MPSELHVNVGGTWERAVEVSTNVSGVWRRCAEVWTNVAGAWRKAFGDLAAATSGHAISRPGAILTNFVTITAVLGSGSYSYSWARISGSTTPAISSTTSSTVRWSIPVQESVTATWRCTVTDTYGAQVTVDVAVNFIVSG